MPQGGNGRGNGGGNGNGRGGGRPGIVDSAYAGFLRHYIPFQDGAPSQAVGDRVIKNFAQRKFDPDIKDVGSPVGPFPIALLYGGRPALAPYFDGADGLDLPSSTGQTLGTTFTIGGYCRPEDYLVFNNIWSKRNPAANDVNFGLRISTTSGLVFFYFSVGGALKTATSVNAVPTTWPMTLIVATYDGAAMKVYINGKLEATTAESGTPDLSAANNIQIGHVHGTGGEYSRGWKAHLFILNRALTHGEVLRLAQQGPSAFTIPDVLLPPDAPPPSGGPPPSGTGYLVVGAGSLLRGVSVTGSSLLNSLIPVGTTPQDGSYH